MVIRAHILLDKAAEASIRDIARIYDLNTNTVRLCLDKCKEDDVKAALFDEQRNGRPAEITDDAVAWIISIAARDRQTLGIPRNYGSLKIFISIFRTMLVKQGSHG